MKKSGFTILELLVAMAVLAILVVLLLNLVDSATSLWRNNENRVDSYREPRAALGIIARDLQNSFAAGNTNFFRLNDPQMSPAGDNTGAGTNAAKLFFVASFPKTAQWAPNVASNKSDVCQVGYFVGYGQTSVSSNAPVNTMNLYRFFSASDDSFGFLTGATNTSHYPFPEPGSIGRTDAKVELLARNITSFKVNAYSTLSQTNPTNFVVSTSLVKFVPSPSKPRPDVVEIQISAVNQETSKKLSDQASWNNTNQAVMLNNIQTFRTRLRLRN